MYRAEASSSTGLKTLCSRLAIASTWRRKFAARAASSDASGLSVPAQDVHGTLTMCHSNQAVAAASASQKTMRTFHENRWIVGRGS